MSKSERLELEEVRRAFHLIGECRDQASDPRLWRRHAFDGLCRMLGARGATGGRVKWLRPAGVIEFLQPVVTGFSAADLAVFAQYMRQRDPAGDPIFNSLGNMKGHVLTRTRPQLVDDREWYASISFNNHRRVVGVDHCIYSLHPLGESTYSLIGLHRCLGDRQFSTRQRALLHLFHEELGQLTGNVLTDQSMADGLSPRLRQTLDCLLQGDSEKQVASRLALSLPTVHQYVTALYRHYGVSSRGELLAKFIHRHGSLISQA